ncbi:MAG: fumarylacetoacetate hydrolase family protein [Chloroflexota bacterium]
MRIARVRLLSSGAEHYGVLHGDQVHILAKPPFDGIVESRKRVSLGDVRLLPPTAPVDFWGIGMNYGDHLQQAQATSGLPITGTMRPWHKGVGGIIGPDQPIIIPPEAVEVHYEGELVVVMGKRARRITPAQAPQYILGYTCGNDVSEKHSWEKEPGQWRGKGTDTFAPVGPWIETDIEPQGHELIVRRNGKEETHGNTSQMIHSVYDIVSYISRFITLHPGDLILTGAAGISQAIHPGDVVEVEISGIGTLRNPVEMEKL